MGKKSRRSSRAHHESHDDLPGEEWAAADIESIAKTKQGSWLGLTDGSNMPVHRVVCNVFPEKTGLSPAMVDSGVTHPDADRNPLMGLIFAKWRLQGWFVEHKDGDCANNDTRNMRVVHLATALALGPNADWAYFLTEGEKSVVLENLPRVIAGIVPSPAVSVQWVQARD